MQTLPDAKYTEAFAEDIADQLRAAGNGAPVQVYFDAEAMTWGVRIVVNGQGRYELLMPAPGAIFSYWVNGRFVGGMGMRLGDAGPAEVALRFLKLILHVPTT